MWSSQFDSWYRLHCLLHCLLNQNLPKGIVQIKTGLTPVTAGLYRTVCSFSGTFHFPAIYVTATTVWVLMKFKFYLFVICVWKFEGDVKEYGGDKMMLKMWDWNSWDRWHCVCRSGRCKPLHLSLAARVYWLWLGSVIFVVRQRFVFEGLHRQANKS